MNIYRPSCLWSRSPWKLHLRQSLMDKKAFVKFRFLVEKFLYTVVAKTNRQEENKTKPISLKHWRESEEQFDFTNITPPQEKMAQGQKRSSQPVTFTVGESEREYVKHSTSPAVRNAAKEAHFSPAPSTVLNHELREWWGMGEKLGSHR